MKSLVEEPMKIRKQDTNDVRLALLEQSIVNINETLIRFEKRFDKIDDELKEFRKELNSKLGVSDKKFEILENNLVNKIDNLNNRLWVNFYWILGTMFTLSCAGAGVLAKGFGWFN